LRGGNGSSVRFAALTASYVRLSIIRLARLGSGSIQDESRSFTSIIR